MNPLRIFVATAGIAASLTGVSAIAQTPAQPVQAQPPAMQAPAAQPQTKTVNGLQFKPDGGSGPDKTKFNIVSKSEAKKQQGDMQRSGGNSMSSDGSGGGENSSGN